MAQYVMSMLRVSKIVPPKRQIIKDISLSFFPGAKIGLLGLNGSGKSTVLRIMAKADTEFEGEVQHLPKLRIGYLEQEPKLDPAKTVREEVESGMGEVMEAAPGATIYAGAEDISQIETSHTIQAVADGDEVFGLQIITTPGHTAGHISILDPVGSLFVAGDAIVNNENTLAVSPAQFTADMAMAQESVKKIATFTFEKAVFGHGDPLESGASAAVAELAQSLE